MTNNKIHSILLIFFSKIIVIYFCANLVSPLYANDLGVIGQVYPVIETDLLAFIQKKILLMQKNGSWEKMQNEWKQRVSDQTDRPHPITTMTKTVIDKSWNYDPTITVPYDLKDVNGNILAKNGTRLNPLSINTLHTTMVFYDADDKAQVEWVKKINKKYQGKTKLVLINGSISQQEGIFHQPIFFDQQGKLTKTFHINHVPALVFQEESHLKIMEIVV